MSLHWAVPLGAALSRAESVAVLFFSYTALLSFARGVRTDRLAVAFFLPCAIWTLASLESARSRPWSRVMRRLLPTGLILVAYRQADWFQANPLDRLQRTWVGWDRQILDGWHFRALVESAGVVGPALLDTCYLLLYAVPPLCVVFLMAWGYGDRVNRFLETLLLGTFAAYALLPYFPTIAPRLAFPGDLLPTVTTPLRSINLFLLDHLDISSSVFPSGHVAVAFSSMFGLCRALPERRSARLLAIFSTLVFFATIYGRYHYAADGMASIALSVGAWRICEAYDPIA